MWVACRLDFAESRQIEKDSCISWCEKYPSHRLHASVSNSCYATHTVCRWHGKLHGTGDYICLYMSRIVILCLSSHNHHQWHRKPKLVFSIANKTPPSSSISAILKSTPIFISSLLTLSFQRVLGLPNGRNPCGPPSNTLLIIMFIFLHWTWPS